VRAECADEGASCLTFCPGTLFAADIGDPIDENIYGTHPIYLDTRYFAPDPEDEEQWFYAANPTDTSLQYKSYTHGVYLRNAHAQEVLLKNSSITWRMLGGTVELYMYAGPSADDVTRSYQETTVGFPAMQQYWTFGFHQCRWGYQNWTVVAEVVDDFAKAGIPLETIWSK
jgi:alpha-glucosidase